MKLTNASILADFVSGIGSQGAVLYVDNENDRVGIGTTNPQTTLQVGSVGTEILLNGLTGVITASSFVGNLTGNVDGDVVGNITGNITGNVSGDVNSTGISTFSQLSVGGTTVSTLGVGIRTEGAYIGVGATLLDLRGPGVSTVTVSSGIATINITGSGGGFSMISYILSL